MLLVVFENFIDYCCHLLSAVFFSQTDLIIETVFFTSFFFLMAWSVAVKGYLLFDYPKTVRQIYPNQLFSTIRFKLFLLVIRISYAPISLYWSRFMLMMFILNFIGYSSSGCTIIQQPFCSIPNPDQVAWTFCEISSEGAPNVRSFTFRRMLDFNVEALCSDLYQYQQVHGKLAYVPSPQLLSSVAEGASVKISSEFDYVQTCVQQKVWPPDGINPHFNESFNRLHSHNTYNPHEHFVSCVAHTLNMNEELMNILTRDPLMCVYKVNFPDNFRIHFKNLCLHQTCYIWENIDLPMHQKDWFTRNLIRSGDAFIPGFNYGVLLPDHLQALDEVLWKANRFSRVDLLC